MASEYKEPDTQIPLVIDFLKKTLKLIICWLKLFPKHLRSVIFHIFHKNIAF